MLALLIEEWLVAASLAEPSPSPSMALQVLHLARGTELLHLQLPGGVCYSSLGHREGAYNPCPKWAW